LFLFFLIIITIKIKMIKYLREIKTEKKRKHTLNNIQIPEKCVLVTALLSI